MANPDPKALMDASKAMGDQAKAARQAMLTERTRREAELGNTQHTTAIAMHQAETAVKDRENAVKLDRQGVDGVRASAAAHEQQASEADRAGNHAQATELRETAAHELALATGNEAILHQDQQTLVDERIALVQATSTAEDASQAWHKYDTDLNRAEAQIDAMENKAQMLGQAGRKLALASTEDNVVERATLENDAEKLLKDANGIQIDAAAVNTVTGQTLTVPDVPAPVADNNTSASDAPTDASATGAGADGDTSTADRDGHLQDPLTADDATAATDATTATDTATATATAFDDPLGVDATATASTAAVAPADDVVGTDAVTDTAATAPAFDATSVSDPAADTMVDAAVPDPTFDQPDAAPAMDDFAADSSADAAAVDADSSDSLDS